MKVLVLAPHPFYQERGTPIAVDLLIRALSERGYEVDLLTFHEGTDRQYTKVRIIRIRPFFPLKNIRPGISWKKIICDIFMTFRFINLMIKNKYDLVHAVEESAFMALVVCPLLSVPYIYDMDSSMVTQIIDKYKRLAFSERFLRWLESLPMRFADAVIPVCDALRDVVTQYRTNNVLVLKDISMLEGVGEGGQQLSPLDVKNIDMKIIMYIGNLEPYQGIDLLLESFAILRHMEKDVTLIIVGGHPDDIKLYQGKAGSLDVSKDVIFLGKKPVAQIGHYMSQADVLVSPRTKGVNTPMKIYSYLHSGKAVVVTDLPTHTQVVDSNIGMLAKAEKNAFATAIMQLIKDDELRERLGRNARAYIEREHSYRSFKEKLYKLYSTFENRIVSA